MAENRVFIEGMAPGFTYAGSSLNPLPVILTSNPQVDGTYIYSIANVPGTVAANTFMTLYNPLGSGKSVIVGGMFISTVAAAGTSATQPTRIHRIAAAPTGGVNVLVSDVFKFNSANPDPVVQLKTGNPTVTLQAPASNTPPPVTIGAGGGQFVHEVDPPTGTTVLLAPGEGVAIHNSAGDTAQRWNISLAWAEV
jgi:hypothetical protein